MEGIGRIDEGALEKTSLIQILALAKLSRVSGVFTLQKDKAVKRVTVSQGDVVGAGSNQLSESFGRLLVAWGYISKDNYQLSLQEMDLGGKKHGEILAAMGALNPKLIPEVLERQHIYRLADACSWSEGTYQFSPSAETTGRPIAMWPVFLEALLRRYGQSGLQDQARTHKDSLVKRTAGFLEPYALSTTEALQIYGSVSGSKTVSEMARGRADERAFFIELLILEELGLVTLAPTTVEDQLERTMREFLRLPAFKILGVEAKATTEEITQARERLINKFPADTYGGYRQYSQLVQLIEKAERALLPVAAPVVNPNLDAMKPLAERAFQLGKSLLEKNQLENALTQFLDAAAKDPSRAEFRAYAAWARFQIDPTDVEHRLKVRGSIQEAVSEDASDPDLLAYLGALFRLESRLDEAALSLERALAIQPGHIFAERELESVRMRQGHGKADWAKIDMDQLRINARIILQRRLGGPVSLMHFDKAEIRIGSAENDDMFVSNSVVPQIVRSHCAVRETNGFFYVERLGTGGVVKIGDRDLKVREAAQITANDKVTLGNPERGQVVEFRILDRSYLRELQIKKKDDVWLG